jgi:hypothetical protein
MKRVAGFFGVILFATPCIIVGVIAGERNTASSLAGWGCGLGVALVEGALLTLVASLVEKKPRKDLLVIVAAIVVGALPSGYWLGLPWMATRPYVPHLAEYLEVAATATPNEDVPLAGQLVKGKIIPVNMKKKTIDPVLFDLSSDFRPKNPEEIGAIAALWWEDVRIGTYGGSGGAYREECTVMVWDKTTRTLLSEKSFRGSEPPSTSRNGATQYGDKPYKEIRDYLNGLAH